MKQWLVIQLTPWAKKKLKTKEILDELNRIVQDSSLEVFYPVIDDIVGKHETPYSEYLFLEYGNMISLHGFEGGEIFKTLLKSHSGKPQLLEQHDIDKIRKQIEHFKIFYPKEKVKICSGSLKGNYGEVQSSDSGQVFLKVMMGDEIVDALIPAKWLRKKSKKLK